MSETTTPTHVGIILDGNRRWAKQEGLPTLEGHKQGAEVFREVALHAFHKGVKFVSGFIFSKENWQRTDEEVGYLMNLVSKAVENYLDTFHKEGIRIVILGRRDGLRNKVLQAIKKAEEKTKDNTAGTLALCFNYGGHDEIVDAVQSIVSEGKDQPITADLIAEHLYEPSIPAIDLLIRTSGEQRISGFMLWRAAYSELYFTDTYWPAFTTSDLDKALGDYTERERRFGQ